MSRLLRDELIRDEALKLEAYQDSVGLWTIGVGHLLGKEIPPGMEKISYERAMELLDEDIEEAEKRAVEVFGQLADVADARWRALVNMTFNLGNRIKKFKLLTAAVRGRDWRIAAEEMMRSKWAGQVGMRADRLRDMILHGDEA